MNGKELFLKDRGQNVEKTLEPARIGSGPWIILG